MLYGRNLEIYRIITMLSDEETARLLLLKSQEKGLAKRAIGNKALKYCIDRSYYKDGAYEVEMGKDFSIQALKDKLIQILRIKADRQELQNMHDLIYKLEYQHIAFFFHSFKDFKESEKEEFT